MNKLFTVSALALTLGFVGNAMAAQPMARGGFSGPGLEITTVVEATKLGDDTPVVLVGSIEKSLGDEKYMFKDASGSMTVEIDDDDWNGINATPETVIEISGEVDKEMFDTKIDVNSVTLKK